MTALQTVNLGTPPNGSDGDAVRTAFSKGNANVAVLQTQATLTSATLITSAQALTTAHIGTRVNINLGTAGTINLPAASTCAPDQVTLLRNLGATVVTLAITAGSGDTVSVSKLNPGETALMDTDGLHAWTCLMRGRTNSDNETVNGNCTVAGNETVNGTLSVLSSLTAAGITISSSGSLVFTDGTKLVSAPAGRNKITNGHFRINQRLYASGASLTNGSFCFDRWFSSSSGSSMAFTAQQSGQQVTVTGSFAQVVPWEELPAGTYALSWSGSATGRVYKSGGTPPSYASSPITATIDGAGNYIVEFSNGTLDFVQLEKGSATPYEWVKYGAELSECLRWYETRSETSGGGQGAAGNVFPFSFPWKVRKRSSPSVSGGNGSSCTNCGISSISGSVDGMSFNVTVTTTNAFVYLTTAPFIASCEITS